jgi:Tfp pilus assembly PilM family ATPase
MGRTTIGVDPGSQTIKVVAARMGRNGVQVTRFAAVPREAGELGRAAGSLKNAVVGLTGREVILRYSQVPNAPDWQLKNLMDLEIQELAKQAGGDLAADYNLLPAPQDDSGTDTVLMSLAKEAALEERKALVEDTGGSVEAYTPNCIALYNAFLKCGEVTEDEVAMVASIGQETMDLVVVRGADLIFARNVSLGAKVLDDAIASTFNVSARKAATIRLELLDLDPASRGRYASGQVEKVSQCVLAAAGQLAVAFQSTLSFCRAQIKIEDLDLKQVWLCGGAARIKGIKGYLRETLRCKVELFDPFGGVDLSQLSAPEAEELQRHRFEAVAALGLALGPLDPALYSLEILPEAVKRRRRFAQRTVWTILAGVCAAGFLAWLGVDLKGRHERATALLTRTNSARTGYERIDKETVRLEEESARLHRTLAWLEDRAVPLHGALHTLRNLTEIMPEDFWITQLQVRPETVDVPGGPKGATKVSRRLLKVTIRGKEVNTTDLKPLFQTFIEKLEKTLPPGGLAPTTSPGSAGTFQAELTIDYAKS